MVSLRHTRTLPYLSMTEKTASIFLPHDVFQKHLLISLAGKPFYVHVVSAFDWYIIGLSHEFNTGINIRTSIFILVHLTLF